MNVKELKQFLSGLPDDMEIIIQKDGEGNDYSPLYGADSDAIYIPDSTWSGRVYSTNWKAYDVCMEEKEWENMLKNPRCLVLHPVN